MMYIKERSYFGLFTSSRVESKRSLPANSFGLIIQSFDENLLRRLKTLNSAANPPSISLSWLSSAVDFLSSTHSDAQALISNLRISSPSEDSLGCYLDDSVKLLDVCNSISSEIERLRQRRLLINLVLHLLNISGEDCQIPAPEKLSRARNSLSDWENLSRGFTKRSFQNSAEALVRNLASGNKDAPRGKITSVGKLVRRTIYAVELVTLFVFGAVTSALHGTPELIRVRVPTEFSWADSFNGLESTISGALKQRFGGLNKKGGLFEEMDELETRVRRVCDVMDDVGRVVEDGGDDGDKKKERFKRLGNGVKEMETATETFSDGLDRMCDGVNKLFHTVLCTREGMLENFRVGHSYQNEEKGNIKTVL